MKITRLKLNERSYDIIAGNNILPKLGEYIRDLSIGNDAYIITNAGIKNKYASLLSKTLRQFGFSTRYKLVPDTEKSKSIETVSAITEDLARYDRKKRIFIIAFGGGVIGDLAGFIASIYKRGTAYIQIPTTLLAQVDSSIGGKTAVDLICGKNLLGTFYQPRMVFSDVGFLKTLDLRQLRSGMAEVIKYGIILDEQFFTYLEDNYPLILSRKPGAMEFVVNRCSRIKARIVEKDERDIKNIRAVLNFGHTIGHAIETAQNYKGYNHGEAIGLGMLIACDLSKSLGLANERIVKRVEGLIKAIGLPRRINKAFLADIINAHYRDKKFSGRKNKFVLIERIGKTKIFENIPLDKIRKALEKRTLIS